MKRSQARSDWQSQCRAAVGFEIPISFLTWLGIVLDF